MPFLSEKNGIPWKYIESIRLDSLTKSYNGSHVVRDLSLTIQGGELIALIGASGSGKTTTLRMMNRLIEPDDGDVLINDIPVRTIEPRVLRRSMGYVIQQTGLLPHLTVSANIGLPLKIAHVPEGEIAHRVRSLLSLVRLDPDTYQHRKPAELSGGQQQRVGLARALATDPPLLLMDEPFGALDPLLRRELQKEFLEIKKHLGITIIFVTHDVHEAFLLGDRVALLHEGGLHALGTPSELLLAARNDPLLSYFIGDTRLSYSITTPAISLALRPDEYLIRTDEMKSDTIRSDHRVILSFDGSGALQGTFSDCLQSTVPVAVAGYDTTMHQAVLLCTRTGSRVLVLHDDPGAVQGKDIGHVILLDDIMQFLFGSES